MANEDENGENEVVSSQPAAPDIPPKMADQTTCHVCNPEDKLTNKIIAECMLCENKMCVRHQAVDDPLLCCVCYHRQNGGHSQFDLKVGPLVDDEGVTHEGRQIELVGEAWTTSAGAIAKSSEEDLRIIIDRFRQLVAEAQLSLDTRRVKLSMAEMEMNDRDRAKRKRRVKVGLLTPDGAKVFITGATKIHLKSAGGNGGTKTPKAPLNAEGAKNLAEMLKKLGFTPEMFRAMKEKKP